MSLRKFSLLLALSLAVPVTHLQPVYAQSDDESFGKKSQLNWPRLKSGSKGASVQALQMLLNAKGSKLKTDGNYGAATIKTVKSFQTSHKLKVDGVVGFQTWEALTPTLRKGDKGAMVKVLQQLLWNNNHGTKRDGIFGTDTEKKIKAFQDKSGISPTGVSDQSLWCALVGGSGYAGGGD